MSLRYRMIASMRRDIVKKTEVVMCAEQSFRLGYSTITWGPTPDLDRVFATIPDRVRQKVLQ